MSTELDCLTAWMERNGHDTVSLQRHLWPVRGLKNIVSGQRPIYPTFRWYFGREFGSAALLEVFGIPAGDYDKQFKHGKRERLWEPEKYAAHKATLKAIQDGRLLPAKNYNCRNCGNVATEYHHPSYAPEDWLQVIPLCHKCHCGHHASHNPLNVDKPLVIET